MEDYKKKKTPESLDKEIMFSQTVKAGKRIYYIDVKRNRKDELFMAITESKKISNGDDTQPTFEKHKIFLYREDFERFMQGLNNVIRFIEDKQPEPVSHTHKPDDKHDEGRGKTDEKAAEDGGDIKIDIDF